MRRLKPFLSLAFAIWARGSDSTECMKIGAPSKERLQVEAGSGAAKTLDSCTLGNIAVTSSEGLTGRTQSVSAAGSGKSNFAEKMIISVYVSTAAFRESVRSVH
jgi:hypothetical protein